MDIVQYGTSSFSTWFREVANIYIFFLVGSPLRPLAPTLRLRVQKNYKRLHFTKKSSFSLVDNPKAYSTCIDGWGYYKMILLLLFLISSTIRVSVAQKPKPIFFHGAQSTRNAAENYKKIFRGFFGWIKMWKMMMSIHKKCCVIKFPKIREFFSIIFSGIPCWLRSLETFFLFWLTI